MISTNEIMLQEADFASLLGGNAQAIGTPQVTSYSANDLQAEVVSQAFTDGAGNYAYLYQVSNVGAIGTDRVTRFTAKPLTNADASSVIGYLTDNIPTGFDATGSQAPLYCDLYLTAGPTVGFNFTPGSTTLGIPDRTIEPGETSVVLYILSDTAPGIINGNLINGETLEGAVVGPVPEPATLALLGLGGVGLVIRKRRK